MRILLAPPAARRTAWTPSGLTSPLQWKPCAQVSQGIARPATPPRLTSRRQTRRPLAGSRVSTQTGRRRLFRQLASRRQRCHPPLGHL